jgi:hypothetical protein
MSTNNVSPQTIFGGTWTPINGRFLVAEGNNNASGAEALNLTAGGTGGEKEHTLTGNETGTSVHSHGMTQPAFTVSGGAVTNGITGGSHAHDFYAYYKADAASGNAKNRLQNGGTTSTKNSMGYVGSSTHTHNLPAHTHTVTRSTNAAVSNSTAENAKSAHNNLPPYLAVYMWERTA